MLDHDIPKSELFFQYALLCQAFQQIQNGENTPGHLHWKSNRALEKSVLFLNIFCFICHDTEDLLFFTSSVILFRTIKAKQLRTSFWIVLLVYSMNGSQPLLTALSWLATVSRKAIKFPLLLESADSSRPLWAVFCVEVRSSTSPIVFTPFFCYLFVMFLVFGNTLAKDDCHTRLL